MLFPIQSYIIQSTNTQNPQRMRLKFRIQCNFSTPIWSSDYLNNDIWRCCAPTRTLQHSRDPVSTSSPVIRLHVARLHSKTEHKTLYVWIYINIARVNKTKLTSRISGPITNHHHNPPSTPYSSDLSCPQFVRERARPSQSRP